MCLRNPRGKASDTGEYRAGYLFLGYLSLAVYLFLRNNAVKWWFMDTPMTPAALALLVDKTERYVRAIDYMRDRNAGKAPQPEKPLDSYDTVTRIGQEFTDHFRAVYRHIRKGRSQDKRERIVKVTDEGRTEYVVSKAFHFDHMTSMQQSLIHGAFENFAHALYHNGASPKKVGVDAVAAAICHLHDELNRSALYDTTTALGCFLYDLNFPGISKHFKATIAPGGIDARRAEPGANIYKRYAQSLDVSREPPAPETASFIHPPGKPNETYIVLGKSENSEGCRFPIHRIESHEFPDGQWHLVLRNGQLVNATQSLRDDIDAHLRAGGRVNDLMLTPTLGADGAPLTVRDYLNTASFSRLSSKVQEQLDAALKACAVRSQDQDAVNPLAPCCIDEDMLTGLRMDGGKESALAKFTEYLKASPYKNMDGVMTAYRSAGSGPEERFGEVAKRLRIARAKFDEGKEPLLKDDEFEKTLTRLQRQLASVLSIAEQECHKAAEGAGKMEVGWVVGPIAGGKGAAQKYVTDQMGPHAIAGLDDSRPLADPSYWLEVITNNHDADYPDSTNFGKLARSTTISMAFERKLSLFIDGTGIPWLNNPQNDELAAKFLGAGYEKTYVGAVAMPLCLVQNPDNGEVYASIFYNLGERGVEQQRYVPLPIVIEKAVKSAIAIQNAGISSNVMDFVMLDATQEGKKPVAAYSINIAADQIDALRTARDGGLEAFQNYLQEQGNLPQRIKDRWPEGRQHGFKVARDNKDGTFRIIILADALFHVSSQETGLLNPKDPTDPRGERPARGVEDLYVYTLSFDFEGLYHGEGGRLKLHEGIRQETHRTLTPSIQQSLLQNNRSELWNTRQQQQERKELPAEVIAQQQAGGR